MESGSTTTMNDQEPKNQTAQETTEEISEPSALEKLQTQLKESESKYVYLYADFENFKKRTQKEYAEALKFGVGPLVEELLPVLDNLERALSFTGTSTDSGLISGLKMVQQQFLDVLSLKGVRPIETQGKAFDPHFHEAVAQEASELPEGQILREELKGYMLHDRLLRPSKVVVSSGPEDKDTKK